MILTADDHNSQQDMEGSPGIFLDKTSVSRYLLAKDGNAVVYASLSFMDSVEDWVLQRLDQDERTRAEVQARLEKLGRIIGQYRNAIPPDNHAFLQAIAWLNSSAVVYVLDYLSSHQPDFMHQLVEHCKAMEDDDVNANLMLKRMRALWRARLLDRIFSPDNVEFVMKVLLRDPK